MVYFTEIGKAQHYVDYHEHEVPWSKVVEIILTTKNKRKKGNKIEIETEKYYILCELKEHILWVINAKHQR